MIAGDMLSREMASKPIRLRVISRPRSGTRTVMNQKNANAPIFKGDDTEYPDWQCGKCGNTLCTGLSVPTRDATRFFPFPTGGEHSVLSIAVQSGVHLTSSVDGALVINCASCGSFNEALSAE